MTNIDDRDDVKQTTDAVMRRDRRRIRIWAVLTIGLWLLAGLLIPSVYLPMGAKLRFYARMLDAANPGADSVVLRDGAFEGVPNPPTTQQVPAAVATLQHHQWIISQIIFHEWLIGAIILVLALGAGILASASTVALALTIRRATLRQVNEGLADIARQLRELQRPPA